MCHRKHNSAKSTVGVGGGGGAGASLMSAQQFIVDRLNEPPFNMRLTLVAFDEKSPFELLEIVNAIMAQLSTEHQVRPAT